MSDPLTPAQVAERFTDALVQLNAHTITPEQFEVLYTSIWTDSTAGGTSIPQIGAQLATALGLWYDNQVQMADWQAGTFDYNSPDPAQPTIGWYPLTNYIGETVWLPCPDRVIHDFSGFTISGTLPDPASFPSDAPNGAMYIIGGNLWVKISGAPVNLGPFRGPTGDTGLTGNTGAQGDKGWSPVHAVVINGNARAMQLVDYVGGAGTKPTANINKYVGSAGYVTDINTAIDVRGPQGAQGVVGQSYNPSAVGLFSGRAAYNAQAAGFSYLATDTGILYFRTGASGTWTSGVSFGQGPKGDTGAGGAQGVQGDTGLQGNDGWAPVLAIVADGSTRKVLQVKDWVGGEGTKPAINKYLGATGFVDAIASAVAINGPQGAQGVQGAYGINGVGLFSERMGHDAEAPGYSFLATDQGGIYVRLSGGGWSSLVPLISGYTPPIPISGTLASGANIIDLTAWLPVTLNDLLVFVDGVEQNRLGQTLVGAQLTITAEAAFAGLEYRVVRTGGQKGDQGPAGAPGPPGVKGDSGDGGSGSGLPTGGTSGMVLSKQSATDGDAAWIDELKTYAFRFDGGVNVITGGTDDLHIVERPSEIVSWKVLLDRDGALSSDIWRGGLSDFPLDAGSSIINSGGLKPAVAAGNRKGESVSLANWEVGLNAGDVLVAHLDSVTTARKAWLFLTARTTYTPGTTGPVTSPDWVPTGAFAAFDPQSNQAWYNGQAVSADTLVTVWAEGDYTGGYFLTQLMQDFMDRVAGTMTISTLGTDAIVDVFGLYSSAEDIFGVQLGPDFATIRVGGNDGFDFAADMGTGFTVADPIVSAFSWGPSGVGVCSAGGPAPGNPGLRLHGAGTTGQPSVIFNNRYGDKKVPVDARGVVAWYAYSDRVIGTPLRDLTGAAPPLETNFPPTGYNLVWEDDLSYFSPRGRNSPSEADRVSGKGVWDYNGVYYHNGAYYLPGFGSGGFIDPSDPLLPDDYPVFGEVEIMSDGIRLGSTIPNAQVAARLQANLGATVNGFAPRAEVLLGTRHSVELAIPFAREWEITACEPLARAAFQAWWGLMNLRFPYPDPGNEDEFEIDDGETFDDRLIHGSVHWTSSAGYPGVGQGNDVGAFWDQSHKYGVVVTQTEVIYYFDRTELHRIPHDPTSNPLGGEHYMLMNVSTRFPWRPDIIPPNEPNYMTVHRARVFLPASNTTSKLEEIPPHIDFAFSGTYGSAGAGEITAGIGTVIGVASGADHYNCICEGSAVLQFVGNELRVVDFLDYETNPLVKFYVGGASATSGFSYPIAKVLHVLDEAESTNWYDTTADGDFDFKMNRYQGAASIDAIVGVQGGGIVSRDAGGLRRSGYLKALGVLKAALLRDNGCVRVILSGYPTTGNAGIISPLKTEPDGPEIYNAMLMDWGGAPDCTLGFGTMAGRTAVCFGWQKGVSTKRMANGGPAALTGARDYPHALDYILMSSSFGDVQALDPARIERITVYADATMKSDAIYTSRTTGF